jgi:hypothetical protein
LQPIQTPNTINTFYYIVSNILKSAFIEAFEEIGGVDNLIEWARCNQTKFYRLLARLMPREIHADVNAVTSLVECLRNREEREAHHEE